MDNTFLGPVFQRPFRTGADLVLYSATKFIGGHSDLLAGMALTTSASLMRPMLDYGRSSATIAPDTAWMLTRSIETLWIRMERQAEKAHEDRHRVAAPSEDRTRPLPGLLTPSDGAAYATYTNTVLWPGIGDEL